MKLRFPLYLQTISFLILHLTLLLALALVLLNADSGPIWDALMAGPLGKRIEEVGKAIEKQTSTHPESEWNEILDEYGKLYDVSFYLVDIQGKQLAGQSVTFPDAVLRHTRPGPLFAGAPPFFHSGFARPPMFEPPMPGPPMPGPPMPGPPMPGPPMPGPPPDFHPHLLIHTTKPDKYWIVNKIPIYRKDGAVMPGALVACAPNLWQTRLLLDLGPVLGVVSCILAISILFWWPFAYRITRALSTLTRATQKIAEGRFDTRLKVSTPDEIGSLGESINAMADRLEVFVSKEKRFLGDIAHELSSPVARLQLALELMEDSKPEERERILKDVREDVQEMSSLINELLAFSKAALQVKQQPLVAVNLAALVNEVLAKTDTKGVIESHVGGAIWVLGDTVLLKRSFANIIRNALKYAGKDGPVEIKVRHSEGLICIIFSDNGPGVPPDAVKRLAEPFYRPEASRSRTSGGAGLGLAIVQSSIETCSGETVIRNRQPHGLEVEVRLLPANAEQINQALIADSRMSDQNFADTADPASSDGNHDCRFCL